MSLGDFWSAGAAFLSFGSRRKENVGRRVENEEWSEPGTGNHGKVNKHCQIQQYSET